MKRWGRELLKKTDAFISNIKVVNHTVTENCQVKKVSIGNMQDLYIGVSLKPVRKN